MKIEEGKFYRSRDGRKVGPMEAYSGDHPWFGTIDDDASGAGCWFRGEGGSFSGYGSTPHRLDLVAEWHEDSLDRVEAEIKAEISSPVRTVTRKEIVPGEYGHITISDDNRMMLDGVSIWLPRNRRWKAEELRAAAATLTEIAEALDPSLPEREEP